MDQTQHPPEDRRTAPRFGMRIPLIIKYAEQEIPAFTRDLSARGVFFYVDAEPEGFQEDIEFIITFPPEVTLSSSLHVRCKGKVVRTSQTETYGTGIAAQIHHYQFINVARA